MILQLIFDMLFSVVYFVIDLLPSNPMQTVVDLTSFFSILKTGLYFFGTNAFYMALGSLIFWLTVDIGWGFIEWLYKKIPGVD